MFNTLFEVLTAIPAFLFVFSIVVVFHELGHYWAARACGVKIEAFSLGFGQTLFSWRDKHDTVWRVAALPLGGYVKFFGDAGAASNPDKDRLTAMREAIGEKYGPDVVARCFHFKPVWQRAFVVAAGPVANFILSIAIFAAIAVAYGEYQLAARIGQVSPESPAAEAGLEPGDLVRAVDDRRIRYFEDLQQAVMLRGGDRVDITLERSGQELVLPVDIERRARPDLLGRDAEVGFLGVASSIEPDDRIQIEHGPFSGLVRGVDRTWNVVTTTGQYVGRIFQGRENADQLGGVLRIGALSKKTAEVAYQAGGEETPAGQRVIQAFVSLVTLAALLSVGIGLLNLLPIPVLDGGHLVYYAYEAAAGRPLGEGAQEWGFRIGLGVVLSVMVFAIWNDVRYLGGF